MLGYNKCMNFYFSYLLLLDKSGDIPSFNYFDIKNIINFLNHCVTWLEPDSPKKLTFENEPEANSSFAAVSLFFLLMKSRFNHIDFLNPSIYNLIRWVAWPMGQTNRRPSVWCSKCYFFLYFYRLRILKTIYFCIFLKE